MTGNLYVVSGPSGAGKGTLLALVMRKLDSAWLSVSATTRSPRKGEIDGVHYFFLSEEEFDNLISVDGLLEWATVHGRRYGTIRSEVEKRLADGIDVVLEIDPQGAFQVKAKMPQTRLIFIAPPSMEVLEARLRSRATEDEDAIIRRLADAHEELKSQNRFEAVIINDEMQMAAEELYEIISKISRNEEQVCH